MMGHLVRMQTLPFTFTYTGYAMAFRGDLIRCTVGFKDEKKISSTKVRVPVVFTLNGKRITPEGQQDELFTHYDPNGQGLFPYIGMMDKGCSVLAKVMFTYHLLQFCTCNTALTSEVTVFPYTDRP